MLKYLRRTSIERYVKLIQALNIRPAVTLLEKKYK